MTVNGKEITLQGEISLYDFLIKEGYDPARVAVERNKCILPSSSFQSQILAEDDCLEIIQFVGGG